MTLYLHIPFCKKACYYCDFHFSTSISKKEEMIKAITKEIILRKNELTQPIETIYLGGGTPSILSIEQLQEIFKVIFSNFQTVQEPEITLEANPDDLTLHKIIELSKTKINRLSIGIQSFNNKNLILMNRAHSSEEAIESLQNAQKYFQNISIDLMYGMPNMTLEHWKSNINTALSFNIPHISCYALTVEPKTALQKMIANQQIKPLNEAMAQKHFNYLIQTLQKNDFIHYEMSNFGKIGFFSKNNTNYWTGKTYVGIGPSAHSFDGSKRSWNIANNNKYIQLINQNTLPSEHETLSPKDLYNEYIMTSLRTMYGVYLPKIKNDFGIVVLEKLLKNAEKHIHLKLLTIDNNYLKTTNKGKFLSDGIISDLFLLHLNP